MVQYRRIVSYLYKYSGGRKGENTGFVRVEKRESGLRIQFHIKDLKMMDERMLRVYFYSHKDSGLYAEFVDKFLCQRGNCEYKRLIPPEEKAFDFDSLSGVIFCDERGLLYGSCWDEQEIKEEKIHFEEEIRQAKDEEEEIVHQKEEPSLEEMEVVEPLSSSPMHVLFHTFPKLTLSNNSDFIELARIELKDISKFSYQDWKLAENAFLKQGYESHGYLLFGRIEMKPGQMVWILGVPGVYSNKEKYLANIFGFSNYIPEEKSEFCTGGKGYWIRQLAEI